MEENQTQLQNSFAETSEPVYTDNSSFTTNETANSAENQQEGYGQSRAQAQDPAKPSQDLILGKFKSVEDLTKAYEELQRYQGVCSEELGELRKNTMAINQAKENLALIEKYRRGYETRIRQDQEKYSGPEYFQDPTFREMYGEVFKVFGENLDTDRFVNLLEGYVSSRILANEKKKSAKNETEQVINSMSYSKNSKSSITPPKKRFDEMTQEEVHELLERLI